MAKNGTLLWIDDEIELLRAHILFLKGKDYEIDTATNGRDAVDRCRERSYDLILLDENMPGLTGLETLTLIKEVQPTVPVVMVTKSEEENIMNQAIGAKVAQSDYDTKMAALDKSIGDNTTAIGNNADAIDTMGQKLSGISAGANKTTYEYVEATATLNIVTA